MGDEEELTPVQRRCMLWPGKKLSAYLKNERKKGGI